LVIAGRQREENKDFFFEKKKQKTFDLCGPRRSQRAR
jgi:hypothetical protein